MMRLGSVVLSIILLVFPAELRAECASSEFIDVSYTGAPINWFTSPAMSTFEWYNSTHMVLMRKSDNFATPPVGPAFYSAVLHNGTLVVDTDAASSRAPIELASDRLTLVPQEVLAIDEAKGVAYGYIRDNSGAYAFLIVLDLATWQYTELSFPDSYRIALANSIEFSPKTSKLWQVGLLGDPTFHPSLVVTVMDITPPFAENRTVFLLPGMVNYSAMINPTDATSAMDSANDILYVAAVATDGSQALLLISTVDLGAMSEVSTVILESWSNTQVLSSIHFDSASGTLYLTSYNSLRSQMELYSVDPSSGVILNRAEGLASSRAVSAPWPGTLRDGVIYTFVGESILHTVQADVFGASCCSALATSCTAKYAESYGCLVTNPFPGSPIDGGMVPCNMGLGATGVCLEDYCRQQKCLCTLGEDCAPDCAAQLLPARPSDGCYRADIHNSVCDYLCMTKDALFDGGDCLKHDLARRTLEEESAAMDMNGDGLLSLEEISLSAEDFMRFDVLPDGRLDLFEFTLSKLASLAHLYGTLENQLTDQSARGKVRELLMEDFAFVLFSYADSDYDSEVSTEELLKSFAMAPEEIPAFEMEEERLSLGSMIRFLGQMSSGMLGEEVPQAGAAAAFAFTMADYNRDGILSITEASILGISSAVLSRISGGPDGVRKSYFVSAVSSSSRQGCSRKFKQIESLNGDISFTAPLLRSDAFCSFLLLPQWFYPAMAPLELQNAWKMDSMSPTVPKSVVSITDLGQEICQGTLLSPDTVVTAASCVTYFDSRGIGKMLVSRPHRPDQAAGFRGSFIHPGFKRISMEYYEYNIAVLMLDMPLDDIEIAPLHDGGDLTIDEEEVCFERKLIVVGNSSSEVTRIANEDCADSFRHQLGYGVISSSHICSDSGRPINLTMGSPLLDRDGLLVGVASLQHSGTIQTFTRISKVHQWLLSLPGLGYPSGRPLSVNIVSSTGPAVEMYPGSVYPEASQVMEVASCDANSVRSVISDQGTGAVTISAVFMDAEEMSFVASFEAGKCVECQCQIQPPTISRLDELKRSSRAYQGGFSQEKEDSWVCMKDWDQDEQIGCGVMPGEWACFRRRTKQPSFGWRFMGVNSDLKILSL